MGGTKREEQNDGSYIGYMGGVIWGGVIWGELYGRKLYERSYIGEAIWEKLCEGNHMSYMSFMSMRAAGGKKKNSSAWLLGEFS